MMHDLSSAKRCMCMCAKFYRPRGAFLAPPGGWNPMRAQTSAQRAAAPKQPDGLRNSQTALQLQLGGGGLITHMPHVPYCRCPALLGVAPSRCCSAATHCQCHCPGSCWWPSHSAPSPHALRSPYQCPVIPLHIRSSAFLLPLYDARPLNAKRCMCMCAKFYRPRGAFLAPPGGWHHPTS
jgi:hypothetical protein